MKSLCQVAAALAFSSLVSHAQESPVVFTAALNGLNESPPTNSPGTGTATLTYDAVAQTLRIQLQFQGLTAPSTASHVHATTPSAGSGTAGVAISFSFPLGVTGGNFDHTLLLTDPSSFTAAFVAANGGTLASAQAALVDAMRTGKAYVDIHTTIFAGGEIRGFVQQEPVITTQPVSTDVCAGANVSFSAAASGTPVPSVRWQVSTNGGAGFADVLGATSTTLTVAGVTPVMSGYQYRAVFTNAVGSATTNGAVLNVDTAPAVTLNPGDETEPGGTTAMFSAAASGQPAPAAQWQVSVSGGAFANVLGATSAALMLPGVTPMMNGNQYRAVFTNVCGAATTAAAALTVGAPFTDPTLTVSSTPIRAVHLTELRTRIDAVRQNYGLGTYASYSRTVSTAVLIRAADVVEMHQALLDAYNAANAQGKALSPPVYTTTPATGGPPRAADIADIRKALVFIETH